jgi:hypothetical protein
VAIRVRAIERLALGGLSLPYDGVSKREEGGGESGESPPATMRDDFARQSTIFYDSVRVMVAPDRVRRETALSPVAFE